MSDQEALSVQEVESQLGALYPGRCQRFGMCTLWAVDMRGDAEAVVEGSADLDNALALHGAQAQIVDIKCRTGQQYDLRKDFNQGICTLGLQQAG